jgi:type VI secretion system secreted protein Hcp
LIKKLKNLPENLPAMKTFPTHFYNALRSFTRAAILLAICLTASQVQAAVDAFIWFESQPVGMEIIKGQSTDVVFTGKNGWSALQDFNFGVENPTTIGSATGGAGAGKIKFNEFSIKKTTDVNSPAFFKNCAAGAHYKNVTIAMRKSGGDPSRTTGAYLVFQFETVFTTKIDWSGPGDEGPEESITFVYGKLNITYRQQNSDGTIEKPGTTQGWDQVLNRSSNNSPDSVP